MKKSCVLIFGLAACGGGGGGSGGPDAASQLDSTTTPDAAQCAPGVPASTVIAHGGATVVPAYTEWAEVTSTGEVAVMVYDGANGQAALTWDGSAWTSHSVYTNSNGGFGGFAFTELAGKPAFLATPSDQSSDSDKLRFWLQLDTGGFATGQRVDPSATTSEASEARWTPSNGVLAVAASNQQDMTFSYERTSAGTWVDQIVDWDQTATELHAAGIGTLGDGTSVEGVYGTHGFLLYRRTGNQWSLAKTYTAQSTSDAKIVFPPEGSSATAGVALWIDPTTFHIKGAMVSLTDGSSSGGGDLLPDAG